MLSPTGAVGLHRGRRPQAVPTIVSLQSRTRQGCPGTCILSGGEWSCLLICRRAKNNPHLFIQSCEKSPIARRRVTGRQPSLGDRRCRGDGTLRTAVQLWYPRSGWPEDARPVAWEPNPQASKSPMWELSGFSPTAHTPRGCCWVAVPVGDVPVGTRRRGGEGPPGLSLGSLREGQMCDVEKATNQHVPGH